MIHDGIKVYQGLEVQAMDPVDLRLVLNQDDLNEIGRHEGEDSDYNLNRWPDHYFFLLEDDGQLYEFIKDSSAQYGFRYERRTFNVDGDTIVDDGNEIFVPIDNTSIVVNSEGLLEAVAKSLSDSEGKATEVVKDADDNYRVNVLFDDETLKLKDNKLYVPIDEKTIVMSEGKLVAVPEPLESGKATAARYDSEKEVIDVLVDSESIIINPDNKLAVKLGTALALNNGVSVKFSHPIRLNVDGALTLAVDNETIVIDSEGIKVPLGKALDVVAGKVDVLVDDETVKVIDNKLEVQFDKDRALDLDAAKGLFVKVDNKTIMATSEGLKAQYKAGEALELDNTTFNILYDDKTIKLTSEGRLTAVPESLMNGHATEVKYVDDSEVVNVLHDDTLKLVNDELRVNIDGKTLKDSAGELYVAIDNNTLYYSSEGVIRAKAVSVNAGHAVEINDATATINVLFDDTTVKENADKKLYIPIDKESLVISEGKLVVNKDDDTIYYSSSEGKVKAKQLHIDDKTLVWHNNVVDSYVETRIGGWAEEQEAYVVVNDPNATYSADKSQLEYDLATDYAKLKLNDRLNISYMLFDGSTDSTSAIYHLKNGVGVLEFSIGNVPVEGKISGSKWVFTRTDGTAEFPTQWTAGAGNSPFNMRIESPTGMFHYDPIDGNFIPVDNNTIVLNASGQLRAVAKDLIPGEAIEVKPDYSINAKYDNDTIVLNSENQLEAPRELPEYSSSEEDLFLRVTSEGKLEWAPAGKVDDVLFDGVSVVDANKMAQLVHADSEHFGLVKLDGDTIVLSEGAIKIGHRYVEDFILTDSQGTRTLVDSENNVELDLSNYSLIPETAKDVKIFMDEAISDSEGSEGSTYKITIKLYDKDGNVISTSNTLDLPIESTVIDGHVETQSELSYLVLTLHNGKEVKIPMASVVGGFITVRGDYTGTNSIYGTKNFDGELMNYGVEVLTQVQVDNKTILWNDSEVYLEMNLPSEGDAIELKDLGDKYQLNVLHDKETLKVNDDNKLFVNVDSESIVYNTAKKFLEVPFDKETLFINSEGKVAAHIDEITIVVNSEGFLEAKGINLKEGDALLISDDSESTATHVVKRMDVLYDDKTVVLDSEGKLSVAIDEDSIIIGSEGLLEVDQYTTSEIRTLWHNICVEGEA